MIEQNRHNKAILQKLFATLNLIMKLLYDLSCQDLPPIFEDNLGSIAEVLQKYLTIDEPSLQTDDNDEVGVLEFVKSGIFEVLGLYVQKFEDAFGPYVETFVGSSWNLLTTTGPETKNDILVSKALQFLTSVTRIQQHAQAFNNEGVLSQVVEKVILPNLTLRDSDIEMFEDEPIEFIRRDLEGSDSDTRRRAATDFLRGLMSQYESLVTEVVFRYINHYLSEYSKNPKTGWKAKDTAVYLYSSIAAKGTITASQGVKSTNSLVNVLEFFQTNIANDLLSAESTQPILQVDAIKYLYTFRSQMSKEQWQHAFPLLVKHLASSNYVVYTYAAIAVERVLALTDENNHHIIDKMHVLPLAKELLEHLFNLIEKDKTNEPEITAAKVQENEFLMRCVMRVLIVARDGVIPFADNVLAHMIQITNIISVNPSNPRFYYYHFEAMGALVRYYVHRCLGRDLANTCRFAAPSQPDKFEIALYQPFAAVLSNDIQGMNPLLFPGLHLTVRRVHSIRSATLCCPARSESFCVAIRVLQVLNPSRIDC